MPRQFLNPAPVLHDLLGIDPAFNGSLTFYEIGTTDPKDTWSDHDMTVLNENPVPLDSAARTDTQVWLDGEYTAVLRNEAGETVWTRDLRPEQTGGETLPAKESGKFLTTDGSSWLLETITQVPDPTGFSGRVLSTDGANVLWVTAASVVPPPPPVPEPDWTTGTNKLQLGDILIQWGTGNAGSSGSEMTSTPISFPAAYLATPAVMLQVKDITTATGHALVAHSTTSLTTSGFTAQFNVADRHYVAGSAITTPIPFSWIAVGQVAP